MAKNDFFKIKLTSGYEIELDGNVEHLVKATIGETYAVKEADEDFEEKLGEQIETVIGQIPLDFQKSYLMEFLRYCVWLVHDPFVIECLDGDRMFTTIHDEKIRDYVEERLKTRFEDEIGDVECHKYPERFVIHIQVKKQTPELIQYASNVEKILTGILKREGVVKEVVLDFIIPKRGD